MRRSYTPANTGQAEFDSFPHLSFLLIHNHRSTDVTALIDSGATVNVLPYTAGVNLGATWDQQNAIIPLTGNLSNQLPIPFFAMAVVEGFEPVRLAFAWVQSDNVPVILGQTNFFMEFDVCFTAPIMNLKSRGD